MCAVSPYHSVFLPFRQEKMRQYILPHDLSLLAEGLAVGALIHGGVHLMGAHQNAIQGAIVLAVAVVCALLHGAFDALVGVAFHRSFLLFFWIAKLLCALWGNSFIQLQFGRFCGMIF